MDEFTEQINDAVKEKLPNNTYKHENEIDLSNTKPVDKDSKEYREKIKKELMEKLIEIDKWYNEQARKNVPAIILDSQGRYVGSCGTACFLNYIEAVKNKQVKIHDKKYKKSILKLIKNNK